MTGETQEINKIDAAVTPQFQPKSVDFKDCGFSRQPQKICIFGQGNYKVESFNQRLWAYKTIHDLLEKDECKNDDDVSMQTNDNGCKREVSIEQFDIVSRCFENKSNNCCETKICKNAI